MYWADLDWAAARTVPGGPRAAQEGRGSRAVGLLRLSLPAGAVLRHVAG